MAKYFYITIFVLVLFWPSHCNSAQETGTVIKTRIKSTYLADTMIGLDPIRSISLYLPPGYDQNQRNYPVIYYFHSFFWSNEKMFADGKVKQLFDKAIHHGIIEEFILVAADYSNQFSGSFYENSPVSGRWLDFTHKELVPFIDANFRTLKNRDSRGLAGDMIGGYAALKHAMLHPQTFASVYALHPVGTGLGYNPMVTRPDWKKMLTATSYEDLDGDIFSQIFLSMAQAYSPNPERPPFFADFMVELDGDELVVNREHSERLMASFLLDRLLPEYSKNLHKMRGIKFDWGRYDQNQDHVIANQAFSRKLEEYGIEHYAEEYRGNNWDKNWIAQGRVYSELLPFFNRFLDFGHSRNGEN